MLSPKAEKAMATHSSTLGWKIPWTEEPGRLQPWGSHESDQTEQLHFHFSLSCTGEGMATHSSVLAWRIPGMGKPGGLPSRGSYRFGHDWSDLAAASVSPKKVWLMQMHSIHWRGGKRPKMVEEKKKLCLNIYHAIKYEFYLLRVR